MGVRSSFKAWLKSALGFGPGGPVNEDRRKLVTGLGTAAGAAAVLGFGSKVSSAAAATELVTDASRSPADTQVAMAEEFDRLYARALKIGAITPGQFNGLGSVALEPDGTGELRDTINRNCWLTDACFNAGHFDTSHFGPTPVAAPLYEDSETGLPVFEPSTPVRGVTITSITIAGLPMNIGSQSAPIELFAPGEVKGRLGHRLALVGQTIRVGLWNPTGMKLVVSGGVFADEMNPYAFDKSMALLHLKWLNGELHDLSGDQQEVLREVVRQMGAT